MDKQDFAAIVQSICARTGVEKPNNTIIRNVIQFCNSRRLKQLKKEYPNKNEFLLAIVEAYISTLRPEPDFDYNEYVIQHNKHSEKIEISSKWLQENLPMDVTKSMSIYIDTRLRRVYTNGLPITNFEFTLIPRGMQSILGDGNIQARVMPSQVTYFKLGSLVIPYPLTMRSANYMKEITLTFTALTSNGILANEQTYHFIFTYTVINDALVQLIPVNKYCKFCPPLRLIDDISLRFSDPLVPIAFNADRMVAISLNYLSVDGRITLPSAHNLATGDVVIIQSLTTGDDAANATILAQIQNPRGLAITVINPTIIAIGIDFTAIVSPDITSLPLVIFYSKTFRFPVEIGYQDVTELD